MKKRIGIAILVVGVGALLAVLVGPRKTPPPGNPVSQPVSEAPQTIAPATNAVVESVPTNVVATPVPTNPPAPPAPPAPAATNIPEASPPPAAPPAPAPENNSV